MSSRAIVVGAGPAGSVAALVLARAGVDVELLDRATFPRPKLCGDTVNPGTLAMLDGLGVGATVRARSRPVTGMLVTGPRGAAITGDYPEGVCGASIERRNLDSVLIDAALLAGARFMPDVRVDAPMTAQGSGRVVGVRTSQSGRAENRSATIVIAADGRASRLASALGLSRFAPSPRRWALGAYFAGVTGTTTRGEMHIRGDRYVGIAPIDRERVNVCVVSERANAIRAGAEAMIEAAIRADPALSERFRHAERTTAPMVLGPLAVNARAAGCPGLLLAGDAAGFVDPMTGDGLRFAVRGGMLAAEYALRELQTGDAAYGHLERARRREFAVKWRLNRTLRWIVGSPGVLDVAAVIGTRCPSVIRTLVSAAGDVGLTGREANSFAVASRF